ncbi:hypothetical protein ACFFX0_26805 [Citricoccus parietis]|uniref:Uncharacterized protein n=1 Tax=Citricoccus parietis TaxID=592307 RepID=A0ABV5G6L7_9MICC
MAGEDATESPGRLVWGFHPTSVCSRVEPGEVERCQVGDGHGNGHRPSGEVDSRCGAGTSGLVLLDRRGFGDEPFGRDGRGRDGRRLHAVSFRFSTDHPEGDPDGPPGERRSRGGDASSHHILWSAGVEWKVRPRECGLPGRIQPSDLTLDIGPGRCISQFSLTPLPTALRQRGRRPRRGRHGDAWFRP